MNRLGGRHEAGLLVAGLGLEHFLDLLEDAKDEQHGLTGGPPRTIEGPLYVAGAPIAQGVTRMDDGSEDDVATTMFLQGRVTGPDGKPPAERERGSCRERGWEYVKIAVVAGAIK